MTILIATAAFLFGVLLTAYVRDSGRERECRACKAEQVQAFTELDSFGGTDAD